MRSIEELIRTKLTEAQNHAPNLRAPGRAGGGRSRSKRVEVPSVPDLREYVPNLVKMVAATSYLPDAATVGRFDGAVFPTVRSRNDVRLTPIKEDGVIIGLNDDNTTPRWALLWAHGYAGTCKSQSKGWTFAHVWPTASDIEAYTHLANLLMIPECFASLTDKEGPLTQYLRYHTWQRYGWLPRGQEPPSKPDGYDEISWRYFDGIAEPKEFVLDRINQGNCQRAKVLKGLMNL